MRFGSDSDTPAPGFRVGYGFVVSPPTTPWGYSPSPLAPSNLLVQNGFPSFHSTDSTTFSAVPHSFGRSGDCHIQGWAQEFFTSRIRCWRIAYALSSLSGRRHQRKTSIAIAYANSSDLNIGQSLIPWARVIQFTYDGNGKLQSIRQLDGAGTSIPAIYIQLGDATAYLQLHPHRYIGSWSDPANHRYQRAKPGDPAQ